MPFTKEEIREIDRLKVEAAGKFKIPLRPWTPEARLEIMKHNAEMTPIGAIRMMVDGHYKVAAAMIRHVEFNLRVIQGIEDGTIEEISEGEFIVKATGEVVQ